MNNRALILLMFLLSGCTTFTVETVSPQTTTVTWIKVDDIDALCRQKVKKKYAPYPITELMGCAETNRSRTKCTIYTGKQTKMGILGHELRHCFEEDWHK